MKLNFNLIYCNEQTVSSTVIFKSYSSSASQKISVILWNPKAHHRLNYIPPLVLVLKPAESTQQFPTLFILSKLIVDPINTLYFIADLQHGIFLMFVTRVGEGKLKTVQYKQVSRALFSR